MQREDLYLINLLPGLYLMRDQVGDQIKTIETKLGIGIKRKGRPPKIEGLADVLKVEKDFVSTRTPETRSRISASAKARWSNMPKSKKKALLDKMVAARMQKRAERA